MHSSDREMSRECMRRCVSLEAELSNCMVVDGGVCDPEMFGVVCSCRICKVKDTTDKDCIWAVVGDRRNIRRER